MYPSALFCLRYITALSFVPVFKMETRILTLATMLQGASEPARSAILEQLQDAIAEMIALDRVFGTENPTE